jgi:hypothetical protein
VSTGAFSARELTLASVFAILLQVAFLALLAFAGDSRGKVREEIVLLPNEIPIAVTPMLDDLPLLKLGSKKTEKPRLPEMWRKKAPRPVKRYEERSAPSEQAEDEVEKIPESKLADKEHEAPPEDAEVIKEVDQELLDEEVKPEEEAPMVEEGAADGVAEGTETDPLKARQVDQYRLKIAQWFRSRFTLPTDTIPCEVLKTLSTGVSVSVGGDRRIVGFTVSSPSGNPTFDAKVTGTIAGLTGQQLPPPPPLYPDILGTTVYPRLSGAGVNCN